MWVRQLDDHFLRDLHWKGIREHLARYLCIRRRRFNTEWSDDELHGEDIRPDDWIYAMSKKLRNFGALTALLLLLLPNVEVITVREYKDDGGWIFSLLAEAARIQRHE